MWSHRKDGATGKIDYLPMLVKKTKNNYFLLMVLFLRVMVLPEPSVGCQKLLSTLSTCKGPESLESSFFCFLVVFLIVFSTSTPPQDSIIIIAQSEQKQMKSLLSGQRKIFFYSLLASLWTLLKSSVLWNLFSLRKLGCQQMNIFKIKLRNSAFW